MIRKNAKISMLTACMIPLFCGQAFAKDVIKETADGGVDWSEGIIFSYGYGAVPNRLIGSPRGRLNARRVAIIDAYRSLAETTEGVQLTSETTVKDGILLNDTIKTVVRGLVRGAENVGSSFEDNIYKVKLAMPISGKFMKTLMPRDQFYGLMESSSLHDKQKQLFANFMNVWNKLNFSLFKNANAAVGTPEFSIHNDKELEAAKKILKMLSEQGFKGTMGVLENTIKKYASQAQYSGLIVDASGVPGFEMATIPFLKTKSGKPVYPSKDTDYDFAVKHRVVSYDFDVEDAIKNKRVSSVPFVIKALNLYKSKKSDLVISDEDADRIRKLASISDNVSKAKVIIVVAE